VTVLLTQYTQVPDDVLLVEIFEFLTLKMPTAFSICLLKLKPAFETEVGRRYKIGSSNRKGNRSCGSGPLLVNVASEAARRSLMKK
jgi:hypothetical protein